MPSRMRDAAWRPYCRSRACGGPETSISGQGSTMAHPSGFGRATAGIVDLDASGGTAMKAAVIHAPHDLRIEEREVPALGPRDVKVRVRAGGICGSDLHYFHHGG